MKGMKGIRSISEIGNIWPRCTDCGHIAQSHDEDGKCCEFMTKQCPTCGTQGVKAQCACKRYKGMTRKEWSNLLTDEEIKYYHFDEGELE